LLSKLTIGTSGQILTSSGTAPQWSTLSGVAVTTFSAGTTGFTPSSATSGAVTLGGTLATTNGGTGLTSFTANGVVYASSTSALATGSALTFDGSQLVINGSYALNSDDFVYSYAGGTSGQRRAGFYLDGTNGQIRHYVSGSEQMRLTSTGLGIGTSSTDRKLTVYTTDATGKMALFSNGYLNTNFYISCDPSSGGGVINISNNAATAAFPLLFQMNGTEKMRLDASGNLLVGDTVSAGAYRLQVTATTATGAYAAFFNGGSSAGQGPYVYLPGNRSSDTTYTGLAVGDDSGARFKVLGNGNVQNTNNSYGAISDAKLKENIVNTSPKLADLMQVQVRNYNLIGETSKQIGVVAQELETVFPAMVDETPDKDKNGNNLGTTTKSVKYSVFVPMLIKAMQEQQAMIESLTKRLAAAGI
jgi:hypothetical protein